MLATRPSPRRPRPRLRGDGDECQHGAPRESSASTEGAAPSNCFPPLPFFIIASPGKLTRQHSRVITPSSQGLASEVRVFRVSAQTVAAAMLFMLAGLLPVQGLLGGGLAPSRGVAASASRAAVDMKVFDWKVRDAPAPELETITLGSLKTAPGSHQKKKRKGRGVSAGQGVTCGFGNRGQKARAGSGTRPGFEGGQTPLYRRLPKWVGKPTGPGHTKKVYGLVKVSPPRTLFRRGTHPTQIPEYARSMQQLAPAMPTHPARCRALPLHPSAPLPPHPTPSLGSSRCSTPSPRAARSTTRR